MDTKIIFLLRFIFLILLIILYCLLFVLVDIFLILWLSSFNRANIFFFLFFKFTVFFSLTHYWSNMIIFPPESLFSLVTLVKLKSFLVHSLIALALYCLGIFCICAFLMFFFLVHHLFSLGLSKRR